MPKRVQDNLQEFRQVFFREKYRFDQGNAFLVFLNFSLLVISLAKQNGGSGNITLLYVTLGIFGTWFLGYFLDKVVNVQDAQEKVVLKRSPIWKENFEHHGNQNNKLEEVLRRMERLEAKLEKNVDRLEEKTE